MIALFSAAALILTAPVAVDGDTLDAGGARYRIENVDAPEMRGGCPASRALAKLAKAELARLLAGAALVEAEPLRVQPGRGAYRERIIALVRVDGRDAGEALIAAGVARPWGETPKWCSQ